MKRKYKAPIICPYCRRSIPHRESQRDHIPPKGIFGSPRPSDLLTVRCCGDCHIALSKGDDILKVVCGTGILRDVSITQIAEESSRAIKRDPWWRKHLTAGVLKSKPEIFKVGSELRLGYKVNTGEEVGEALQITIKRIVKGILFDQDPGRDTTEYKFIHYTITEEKLDVIPELLDEIGSGLTYSMTKGDGNFRAAWGFVGNHESNGIMLMSFFTGLNYLVYFGDPDEFILDQEDL